MLEKPAFIQGIFPFDGQGLERPVPLSNAAYTVPADKRAQTIYFRAGNASAELICLVLKRNGKAMRYFPIGAKGSIHVALAVVEDLLPGSVMEISVTAPKGVQSVAVVDVGFMEIE